MTLLVVSKAGRLPHETLLQAGCKSRLSTSLRSGSRICDVGEKGCLQGQFQASSKGLGVSSSGVASKARPTTVSTSATLLLLACHRQCQIPVPLKRTLLSGRLAIPSQIDLRPSSQL